MSGDYQSIFDIIHPGRIGPVQQIRDQVAVLIVVVIFNIFGTIEVETVTLFIWMLLTIYNFIDTLMLRKTYFDLVHD